MRTTDGVAVRCDAEERKGIELKKLKWPLFQAKPSFLVKAYPELN